MFFDVGAGSTTATVVGKLYSSTLPFFLKENSDCNNSAVDLFLENRHQKKKKTQLKTVFIERILIFIGYQIVDSKNPVTGIKESNPQVTVKGVGYVQ